MIVSLTGKQWNTVANRIPAHWRQAMKQHRSNNYGRTYSYDLPAICWRRLFDHLSAQATGPLGGFTTAPDALYSALAKIIREVMKIEQHPALTPGLAVTGSLPDIIPAWETRPVRSCYPTDEAPFVLLVPRHFTERGWALTTWISAKDCYLPERLADCEHAELLLGREVFGSVVELGGVPQD